MSKIIAKLPLKLIWEAIKAAIEVLIITGRDKEAPKSSRPE
jgi:hypothetical protein